MPKSKIFPSILKNMHVDIMPMIVCLCQRYKVQSHAQDNFADKDLPCVSGVYITLGIFTLGAGGISDYWPTFNYHYNLTELISLWVLSKGTRPLLRGMKHNARSTKNVIKSFHKSNAIFLWLATPQFLYTILFRAVKGAILVILNKN
jgi:hypothetical protein